MIDVATARHQMVEQQVRAWSVLDLKVLDVMDCVAREQFVPPAYRDVAYADMSLPLGHGQTMLAPKMEGRILQALAIQPQDRALEVGTGSGYFAACLAQLARSVHSIEIMRELAGTARANLERNGARSVTVEVADAMGLEDDGKWDVIALTGSLPVYDPRFERALTPGGRLFAVVGAGPMMEARRITRVGPPTGLGKASSRRGSTRSSTPRARRPLSFSLRRPAEPVRPTDPGGASHRFAR